ncbi:MAG: hypothetical protein HRU72_01275 [Planctomycetia bacterium]|nr:MAG: hypothetical protein HRU72_01275 [Planctomycetia bacterium]
MNRFLRSYLNSSRIGWACSGSGGPSFATRTTKNTADLVEQASRSLYTEKVAKNV